MDFSVTVLSTYFAAVAGRLAAVLDLVTLAAVVVICLFFFVLTRQRFSYWT